MPKDAIYKYIKKQNRPFSVNDIVSNLHNEYGKAAVQKALDQLVADQKVFEKVYGKQKIYCVVQDSKYTEELMRIDKELQVNANEVESKYQELEKEVRAQEAMLAALQNSMTVEEARAEKERVQQSVRELTDKLEELMGQSVSDDLSETKRKAEQALQTYSKAYSNRKRLLTNIIDCILESYSGTKASLYEEIGIEPKIV